MAGALIGPLPVAILCSFFVEYHAPSPAGAVKECPEPAITSADRSFL